jgi:hypothetical protein
LQIVEQWKAGARICDLAAKYGIAQPVISCHIRRYARGGEKVRERGPLRQDIERTCDCCGKEFTWTRQAQSVYHNHLKQGRRKSTGVYCGAVCGGRASWAGSRPRIPGGNV